MTRILNIGVAIMCLALLSAVLVVPVAAMHQDPNIQNSVETTALAPTVAFVSSQSTSVDPMVNGQATLQVNVVVTAPQGTADITGVQAMLTSADGSQTVALSGPDNAQSTTSSWSGDGIFAIPYWWASGPMSLTVTATTTEGLTGSATIAVQYTSALGVTVDTPSLDFGSLTYNQVSADQTATIHNSANTAITSVTGAATDWASDGTGSVMPASALHLSTPDTPMSNSDTTISGALGVQTSDSSLSSASMAFHVVVPGASDSFQMQGNYNSQTTLTAFA